MERLRELRVKYHMSQLQLAMALHCTQTSISKYETGHAIPDAQMIIKMAKLFNVSTDYLLDLTPFPSPESPTDLSFDDRRLLSLYSSLPLEKKRLAIAYLSGLASKFTYDI